MKVQIGDMVEVINNGGYSDEISFTGPKQVKEVYWESESGVCVGIEDDNKEGIWALTPTQYKPVNTELPTDNYSAAFNMWMDEYINDPQSFEDAYSTALNHVSEKLLGEEPSYGAVAAEQFKRYLDKIEKGE